MRTMRFFARFFNAAVVLYLWLAEETVDAALISAPDVVTAVKGGMAKVSCNYDKAYKSNTKYWCKGPIYELCRVEAKTSWHRNTEGFSITDNQVANVITVTMTSVQESDQDMYWCVISLPGRNAFCPVRLLISNAVSTTTAAPSDPPPSSEYSEIRWWQSLRWISFFIMASCPLITYTAVWRINSKKSRRQHHYLNVTQ